MGLPLHRRYKVTSLEPTDGSVHVDLNWRGPMTVDIRF